MSGKLAGKTALITGGGRGIGRAISLLFARQGARVAVADLDPRTAQQTAAELPTPGLGLQLDVTKKSQVQEGVAQVLAQLGQLDILVNNAGYVTYSTFEDCSEETWHLILDINLKGTFLCSQAVLSHMIGRRQGAIVNLSSLAAKSGGLAAGPPYAAAKAGVTALTIGLARYLAPHRVRANAIAPGVIDTAMTRSPQHDKMAATIPLGEKGQPEDVANCALFLACEDSRHITGEIIDVNGGLYMD
jgi:NAD(P)-dependent dehydrogenase (short-subunit alcohol dehydrogenase family)